MPRPDLNLLLTLDVLLTEGSVAGAARRLGLSSSAMSRALARLRKTTGDPLLVRAGRQLVPTPRALEIRERVKLLVQEGEAILSPIGKFTIGQTSRIFTLRTSEGFVENFGAGLLAQIQKEAPGIRLRFVPKLDKDSTPLREGTIDLETGVLGKNMGPELRTQILFKDDFIGVVRQGHALSRGKISPNRYAEGKHVCVSRRNLDRGPVDNALRALGLEREIHTFVSGFSSALALARATDLIATVPGKHTGNLRARMHSFHLPFPLAQLTISLFWHPRMDADPAHRWLRGLIRKVCKGDFSFRA